MIEHRRAGVKGFAILIIASLIGACQGGGDGSGGGASTAAGAVDTIAVVREACTPFGNPPRPRHDNLSFTNTLFCSGGGARLPDWTDSVGSVRQACIYEPEQASADNPLPLVFWLHGSAAPGEIHLDTTNILARLDNADLSNDPARSGFILIELAGRITEHFYPAPNDKYTTGWDVWDRQLLPGQDGRTVNGEFYPQNLDAAAIDHYIAEAVATGKIDGNRIYMMGWSTGAGMAMLYGLNRPNIAAVASYSSHNPFDFMTDPCGQVPVDGIPADDRQVQVFNPGVPIFQINNNCEVYGICPSAVAFHETLLATGTAAAELQLINDFQGPTQECRSLCGTDPRGIDNGDVLSNGLSSVAGLYGLVLHFRWPHSWTDEFFNFLRDHPLND